MKFRRGVFLKASAQLGISARPCEEPPQKSLEVERGSACDNHWFSPLLDVAASRGRCLQPPGDAGRFPGLQNVYQMMRDSFPIRRGGFGRTDIHPTVDGHRVHGDDLAAELLGEEQGNFGLPSGCGTGDDQDLIEDNGVHGAWLSSRAGERRNQGVALLESLKCHRLMRCETLAGHQVGADRAFLFEDIPAVVVLDKAVDWTEID